MQCTAHTGKWTLNYTLLSEQAFLIIKDPAPIGFVGNRTECALLMLLRTWDADYTAIREEYAPVVEKVWDFDSAKKMASVLIRTSGGYRLYNKAGVTAHMALHSLPRMCLPSHHVANAVQLLLLAVLTAGMLQDSSK